MAVANHALSCHHYGALIHGAGSPRTSNCKRTVLSQTTVLLASPRHLSYKKRNLINVVFAATAGDALLEASTVSIDVEGVVAEAPTLLALSSDLDWQQSVIDLREEALKGGLGERKVALEAEMQGLLHDSMFEMVFQQPALLHWRVPNPQDELSIRFRVEELRLQASLQAAAELAHGVDSSFDWETEVAELRHCLGESTEQLNKIWWTLGLAMTGWLGCHPIDYASATEESVTAAVTEAATKTAPAWVAPSVLAFPVVSYILFTLYRNEVNPSAKLTDWMFGLVAMAILGNLILIATVGVRLY